MKIIAQKTDFYLNKEFFNQEIKKDYVNGVSFNVVYNKEKQLFVYNYTTSGFLGIQKIQDATMENLEGNKLLSLETALDSMQRQRPDLPIYLNVIPITIDVFDDTSLKTLNSLNDEYLRELKKITEKYPQLTICMHSISRNLTLLLYQFFSDKQIGFAVYTGDLTPIDVDYYVLPTYMMDDTIFEEMIELGKEIYIFVGDGNDVSVVIDKYKSEKSTALSQKVLPYLNFIVNHPNIMHEIFPNT